LVFLIHTEDLKSDVQSDITYYNSSFISLDKQSDFCILLRDSE